MNTLSPMFAKADPEFLPNSPPITVYIRHSVPEYTRQPYRYNTVGILLLFAWLIEFKQLIAWMTTEIILSAVPGSAHAIIQNFLHYKVSEIRFSKQRSIGIHLV